jgi:hypothetical protein
VTPAFALPYLRASPMTLVSTKYMRGLGGGMDPFEIGVHAHIRHRRQNFRERALVRESQRSGQDRPVFGLGTLAVFTGPRLQRPDDGFVNASACSLMMEAAATSLGPVGINWVKWP